MVKDRICFLTINEENHSSIYNDLMFLNFIRLNIQNLKAAIAGFCFELPHRLHLAGKNEKLS